MYGVSELSRLTFATDIFDVISAGLQHCVTLLSLNRYLEKINKKPNQKAARKHGTGLEGNSLSVHISRMSPSKHKSALFDRLKSALFDRIKSALFRQIKVSSVRQIREIY